jgi:molybdate transport system substrate-binding protein
MLTARRGATTETREWLALLSDPDLRLATSTPGCDPSGDYTWQLFSHIEERCPGVGAAMMARARPLVAAETRCRCRREKSPGRG